MKVRMCRIEFDARGIWNQDSSLINSDYANYALFRRFTVHLCVFGEERVNRNPKR